MGRESPPGKRLFFSDDLRVHSLNPDGTGLVEFPGKLTTSPQPCKDDSGAWQILCASYRGPYLLLDEPKPGLYESGLAGGHRKRITDLPAMPALVGLTAGGRSAVLLQPRGGEALWEADLRSGTVRVIPLPMPGRSAAVDRNGKRAAVILEPKMRTVVLGNQAWFTEGSDIVLVDLESGRITPVAFPSLPDPLGAEPKLESFAGGGASAVAWYYDEMLVVSSAPGMWNLNLKDPSLSRMARPRMQGLPPADGMAVDRDTKTMAFTCGGKLFVWDLRTGYVKDITPPGLVGGAHHPVWLEP